MKKALLYLLILLIHFQSVSGQSTDSQKGRTLAAFSMGYSSNMNLYGRRDSVKSSGISPTIELWLSKGSYLSITPTFVSDAYQMLSYSGTSASLGFQKMTGDWFINGGFSKSFYTDNGYLTQTIIKNQLWGSASYFNDLVNFYGGIDLKLSSNSDIIFSGGIDHSFVSIGNDKSIFIVDPTLSFNIGTHYFSKSFINSKYYNTIQNELGKMRLLSNEISLPIMYLKDKTFFIFTPSFVIPTNLISINGITQETASPQFYVSASVRYKITHK